MQVRWECPCLLYSPYPRAFVEQARQARAHTHTLTRHLGSALEEKLLVVLVCSVLELADGGGEVLGAGVCVL